MNRDQFTKIVNTHSPDKAGLERALKAAFGDHSTLVWGPNNEIDWGDGFRTSITECIGDGSIEHEAFSFFTPPEEVESLPLIYDSPHSGTTYPDEFKYSAPHNILRMCEDTYIDSIIQNNVFSGVSILKAKFPRSMIDPNRAETCLHQKDIRGTTSRLSIKSDFNARNGRGLIWMRAQKDAIYSEHQRPDEAEIIRRIQTYHRPYHAQLGSALRRAKEKHGFAYHINWHSCPRYGSPLHKDPHKKRADFILGDRNGTTFDPALLKRIKSFLEQKGYSVAINKPYKGAEIITRHSDPAQHIFCLQIEICRDLYMDEQTLVPHKGIRKLAGDIQDLTADISAYIKALPPRPKATPSLRP